MKALKKTFSVILCLCMIMSVMAAGLNAFAQEEATAALDGAVSEAAALVVSDPTDEKPDVDAMERTKVKYPIGASKKAVNRSIGRVEDILFTILKVPEGGVPQVLNEKVYTVLIPFSFANFSPRSCEREYTAKSSKSGVNFNPSIKLLTIQPVPMTANFIFFPAFSDPARHDRADAQREYDIKFVLFVEIYCVGVI